MSRDKILPIAVGAALKSLRNTDFDIQTAICEVIDNSFQAEAKNVKIRIAYSEGSRKRARPVKIAFGDDGYGMDMNDLQYCLKLGYSGRYDDRKGIGRFGVGMTFAAISLCQKIEVYSRQKQGNWHYTYLDISGLDTKTDPEIAPIEQKTMPEEYANLAGDIGTLVIWSMIDRVDAPVNEKEMVHNLGRIYRKFIGSEIISDGRVVLNPDQQNLHLNNQTIHAFDPMYVTKSHQFPDDEISAIGDETTFEWRVHEVDAPSSGQKQGTITIRTSLLPESWRLKRSKTGQPGSGRSFDNLRRKVEQNEGISVMRRGREVAYGPIPHLLTRGKDVSAEIDRFWSCEIDFDPALDHWFSVRNIKIGARPLTELKDTLRDKIKPSVMHFREQIKKTMDEYAAKENESEQGPIRGHKSKEDELVPITTPNPTKATDEEKKRNAEQAAENVSPDKSQMNEYLEKVTNPDNKYNIVEAGNMRPDSPFFEIVPDLETKVVHYNMNHAFFLHLYDAVKKLKDATDGDAEKTEMIDELKGCFDNLFYAYSEAYYDLDDHDRKQSVGETIDELQVKWNYHLRKIHRHLQHDQ